MLLVVILSWIIIITKVEKDNQVSDKNNFTKFFDLIIKPHSSSFALIIY